MVVVRGEGPFADAVRRALEHAQSRGLDLSGVEVEVVPDPSIADFGAYTEHHGGLKFRIRYNPRYAGDRVLAAHEAGHVAYWTWAVKTGKTHFFSNPDVIEPLAEAFGAVAARQLFGVPATFKGAPPNLTKILPERTTYITVTVGGKPTVVKVPEWGDYRSRYRAGILLSPYFYNMTNWAHVFGNFTAMPGDVIETVHKAWQSGAVEVVPGWGAVWRKEPTWSWEDASTTASNVSTPTANTATRATRDDNATQKDNAVASNVTPPQVDAQKAVVHAQPTVVPLPPSDVQPPRYFSSDITPTFMPSEWSDYISGRRVLVVFRNWPSLDTATLKETRRDHVAGAGVVSEGRLRFEGRIPVPRVVDPSAWIELVDEKTGKVLARLRSDELYRLTSEGAPVTLYWSHVAAEEKWPGWERFVDRAKELEEKLGTWRPSGAVVVSPVGTANVVRTTNAVINPDSTVGAVRVANAPTEYVPPKVPDYTRKQFENLLSELKKLGEEVNLRNVGEAHDRFIQLRDRALNIARTYPQLIDEANKTVGETGSRIKETSSKLYDALAKAAGRDSFWRGDGDVKSPIGVYKYDPATGAFLLSLYDRPTAENIVGYIKDDGTPVVVKKTQNMSEALEEYNKLLKRQPPERTNAKQIVVQQSGKGQQTPDFLQPLRNTADFLAHDVLRNVHKTRPPPVPTTQPSQQTPDFLQPPTLESYLTKVPVLGPVLQTTKLLSQMPSAQSNQQTDFLQPLHDALTRVPVVGPVSQTAQLLLQTSGGSKTGTGSHSEHTPVVQTQPTSTQPMTQPNRQRDFLWPVRSIADFLADALKAGAGIKLAAFGITALGGARPSLAGDYSSSPSQPGDSEFIQSQTAGGFIPPPVPVVRAVYNRRRGMPTLGESLSDSFELAQQPKQQRQGEFVVVKPLRPPDYVLAEKEARRSVGAETQTSLPERRPADYVVRAQDVPKTVSPPASSGPSTGNVGARPLDYLPLSPSSSSSSASSSSNLVGARPAGYVVSKQSDSSSVPSAPSSGAGARPIDYIVSQQSSGSAPPLPDTQTQKSSSEPRRHRGRPVVVAI